MSRRKRNDGHSSLAEYYLSPHWLELRRRVLTEAPYCAICNDRAVQVHHRTYARLGHERWPGDVIPLCTRDHQLLHRAHRERRIPLWDFERAEEQVWVELRRQGEAIVKATTLPRRWPTLVRATVD